MLVLSRKTGEQIRIGKDIIITIIKVEGGMARIGIEAPRTLPILRMEVFEKIQNENIDSASKGAQTHIEDAVELLKNRLPKE
jgi:carbon storage regulator